MTVNKSDLVDTLTQRFHHLPQSDVKHAVKTLIDSMSRTLSGGERIEIRGFGSFSLRYHPPACETESENG